MGRVYFSSLEEDVLTSRFDEPADVAETLGLDYEVVRVICDSFNDTLKAARYISLPRLDAEEERRVLVDGVTSAVLEKHFAAEDPEMSVRYRNAAKRVARKLAAAGIEIKEGA